MKPKMYRKKAVVIESMRFYADHLLMVEAAHWCGGRIDSEPKASDHTDVAYWIDIPTLEGVMRAVPGDYIIKGVAGEFYPCKPDIFEQTYEPVSARGGMSTVTARQLSADHLGRVVAVMGVSGRLAQMGAILVGADRQITIALELDGRRRTLTVPTTAEVEVQS